MSQEASFFEVTTAPAEQEGPLPGEGMAVAVIVGLLARVPGETQMLIEEFLGGIESMHAEDLKILSKSLRDDSWSSDP